MVTETTTQSIEAYLDKLTKRNRKADTIRSYRTALMNTVKWMEARGHPTDPGSITEDAVVDFINNYTATENTIHYYIKALNQWCRSNGNTVVEDMNLLWNEAPHPKVQWIGTREFLRIMEWATDPTEHMAIMLMAYAGLRRREVASLEVADILDDRIVVTGKGHGQGKQRIIPLCERLRVEIDRYFGIRQSILGRQRCASFLVELRWGRVQGLSPDRVGTMVHKVCTSARVKATPHTFRRYFATMVWEAMPDKDIKVLQSLMGHTSPVMTLKYIERNDDAMVSAVKRLI